ncbi:Gag protein [Phytophthora palmivora]|uniref:Gag protein n=1 Tax=Phytophthora palmivora TaxID=4796 RepID=A0A2P4YMN9_9STRA|nr:Gag protein [Phytophthora palmivora]
MKPAQPKPLRLKVNPYEGKERENLHFRVREVVLAMDAALISTERLRVAFALSNLGGRAKTGAYTREVTTPGCFTTWAQLCQLLRAAFLPANYEYRQRSHFLVCKQGKRELHEYIQEMRVLAASLVGNPLPEHIKVTVFMDGLKVGPSRTQLFRVHANTMEKAVPIALQEEYSQRQASTLTPVGPDGPGLAVTFENFDSTESFLVLDMDKYDLLLGMPCPNAESRRAVWASTVAVPDGTDQAGNIGPQVGNIGPQAGNVVPQTAETVGEDAEGASGVGNIVPRKVEKTEKMNERATRVSGVSNIVPRGVKKTRIDFLAELKAGEIAEMVLLKPETSPEDLNSSSVMDEDVLEGFTKQRATRLGSEILKNLEDPVYPRVKEFSDVWPLPREQCEVIDAFFAEKAKSGMLNNATVLVQTPIPRKDVLLNNMSGCTLYSALDLVDGYYQILMRESDIPLTARVKPSGHATTPLQSLPVSADYWKSMSPDFVIGLPADDKGNTGILVV